MLTFIALYAIKQPMQAETLATLDSSKYDSQLSARSRYWFFAEKSSLSSKQA
ncbi:hypothetical protein XBFM1_1440004 [Xenorhabdus bovienii str. feltiae Moldova]|uniref:Uncharacterized protein n=1 Tax=Xenorhabdus bovienii str. feltiae Moldova TaxID=1398200 RepID=A0A077NRG8_XENBV|nr:hypothetical protein XBFM1_1440004 [Xenorhabdus bovienii str. feltiae Moldova]